MDRIETGVPGLDIVLSGGIPQGSLVLIEGPPGAGKTVLSTQIGFHHAAAGGRVLMLTAVSESNAKLIAHLNGLEYFDSSLIGNELQLLNVQKMLTDEGLDALLGEIRSTVVEQGISLLIVDSLRGLYQLTASEAEVQSFLFRLGSEMFLAGCTTLVTGDIYSGDEKSSHEQAISDVILRLEVSSLGSREVRKLRVLQVRGSGYLKGGHSYEITSSGVSVHPRIESLAREERTPATGEPLGWGIPRLDEITGGGIPRHDSTLLLGTVGIGKTTLGLHFLAEGVSRAESCLCVAFHETTEQLVHKAQGFGMDLQQALDVGRFKILHIHPADMDVDKVMHLILADVTERGVTRLVLDSIDPMEGDLAREGRFSLALTALVHLLHSRGVTTLITSEMSKLVGQELDVTNRRESYWTPLDNIVLMRSVEIEGALARVFSVLKMRSSDHDERFYGFDIGERGIEIGKALEGLEGLLTGLPRRIG